jgi:PilZ domain-containing protein
LCDASTGVATHANSLTVVRTGVKIRASSADNARMTPLSFQEAADLLFAQPEVELELTGGGLLRIHRLAVEGDRATATAPRLSVATGMFLTGRIFGPDGRPWEISIHVDDASYHTADLAMLRVQVTGVEVDQSRRNSERVPIGGLAWLEAVSCQEVVDGDRVEGTLEDLSRTGVSFTTSRVLRVGDRLMFHGRFFADSISGEVRVASIRPASSLNHAIVGCRFLDIDPESIARIDRILSGGRNSAPLRQSVDLTSLRSELGNAAEGESGTWRKVFRRRDA